MSDVVYGAVFRVESGSLPLILIYLGHQFCLNTRPGRIGQILIHRNWVGVKGPRMVKARWKPGVCFHLSSLFISDKGNGSQNRRSQCCVLGCIQYSGLVFSSWCHLLPYMCCLGEVSAFVDGFSSFLLVPLMRHSSWTLIVESLELLLCLTYVCVTICTVSAFECVCVCVCARVLVGEMSVCVWVRALPQKMCSCQIWQTSSPH